MKKSFFAVLLVLLAVLCFTACSSDNVIVLRSSGPLTGDYSVYGIATNKGMQLAVEEINANGGVTIDGVQYKLDYKMYDDTGDGTKAKSSFLQDAKKVDVWVGSVTSGAADSVATEAAKVNVPMITPSGTADNLTVGANNNRADRSNVFRTCYNDSLQGIVMANFAKELEVKNFSICFFSIFSDYTRLKMISALAISEMCVSDISELLCLNQTTVSHQLRLLKNWGIVQGKRDGKIVFYSLTNELLSDVLLKGVEFLGF